MAGLNDVLFTVRYHHVVVFVLILLIGSIMGGTFAVNEFYKKHAPESCEEFLEVNHFIWLPSAVSDVFEGDIVNLHFSMINGHEISFSGVVERNSIVDLECGRSTHYDFEVWMSDFNALQLATSLEPTKTFVMLWRSGEIRMHANGPENEDKLNRADELVENDEPVPGWIRDIFGRYVAYTKSSHL